MVNRVIIIMFLGYDVSAPFLERSSPASKDRGAHLGEIKEEMLDVDAAPRKSHGWGLQKLRIQIISDDTLL